MRRFAGLLKRAEIDVRRQVLLTRLSYQFRGQMVPTIRAQRSLGSVRMKEFFRAQAVVKGDQSATLQPAASVSPPLLRPGADFCREPVRQSSREVLRQLGDGGLGLGTKRHRSPNESIRFDTNAPLEPLLLGRTPPQSMRRQGVE